MSGAELHIVVDRCAWNIVLPHWRWYIFSNVAQRRMRGVGIHILDVCFIIIFNVRIIQCLHIGPVVVWVFTFEPFCSIHI